MTIDWSNDDERKAAIEELVAAEVTGLKAKNSELLGKTQDLKSKYETVKDVDVEKYQEMIAKENKAEEDLLFEKNEFEKIREKDRNEFDHRVSALQNKNEKLSNSLNTFVIEKELNSAISEQDGNPLFLMPHMKNRVELEENENGFEVVVKDALGNNMFNQDGGKASVEDLVKEFKGNNMFLGAFKGSGSSGTGTQTSPKTTGSGIVNPFKNGDIDAQTKLFSSNKALYDQLKAEA